MEETREVLEVRDIPNETPPSNPKPKRPKAVAVRTMDELDGIAPKKMTDKEKDLYIEELRAIVTEMANINDNWKDQSRSAFERARQAEEDAKRVREAANFKLTSVKDNVRVMANNIMTILEK